MLQAFEGRAGHDVPRADLPPQVCEVALGHDAAVAEHADAVAEAVELGELVAGEQHRDAFFARHAPQQRAQLGDALGVEAVGRLVEQQQLRPAEQRLCDAEPLLHPHRERAHAPVDLCQQSDGLDDAFDLGVREPARHTLQLRERGEVLPRGAVQVESGSLDQRADERVGLAAVQARVGAADAHGAARWPQQAETQAHDGRLAGAVVAEEAVAVPCGDAQGDVADDGLTAVAELQVP